MANEILHHVVGFVVKGKYSLVFAGLAIATTMTFDSKSRVKCKIDSQVPSQKRFGPNSINDI